MLGPDPGVSALPQHQCGGADHGQHLAHVDQACSSGPAPQRLPGWRHTGSCARTPGPRPGQQTASRLAKASPGGHKHFGVLVNTSTECALGYSKPIVRRPEHAGVSPYSTRGGTRARDGTRRRPRSSEHPPRRRTAPRAATFAASMTARMSSLLSSSVGTPTSQSTACAPLVEDDHPRPCLGKTTQESIPPRRVPVQFHVRDGAGSHNHVKRALAQHLIGETATSPLRA